MMDYPRMPGPLNHAECQVVHLQVMCRAYGIAIITDAARLLALPCLSENRLCKPYSKSHRIAFTALDGRQRSSSIQIPAKSKLGNVIGIRLHLQSSDGPCQMYNVLRTATSSPSTLSRTLQGSLV